MAKDSVSIPATIANTPVNVDSHREDMARRAADRAKNRKKHFRCLDPLTAQQYEARKPLYEFKIEVEIFRPASGKKRAGAEKFSEQVAAQNEDDAWAMFCDKIGEWPSRRDSQPTITRLKQRTAEDE